MTIIIRIDRPPLFLEDGENDYKPKPELIDVRDGHALYRLLDSAIIPGGVREYRY